MYCIDISCFGASEYFGIRKILKVSYEDMSLTRDVY